MTVIDLQLRSPRWYFSAVSSLTCDVWRERGALWAFPRKPSVDTAVITCRGREREEEERGQRGAQNLIALVSLLVRSGYLDWPEWTFWNEPASAGTLSSSVLFVCVTRISKSFTPTQASSCRVSTQRLFTRGKCYCGRGGGGCLLSVDL